MYRTKCEYMWSYLCVWRRSRDLFIRHLDFTNDIPKSTKMTKYEKWLVPITDRTLEKKDWPTWAYLWVQLLGTARVSERVLTSIPAVNLHHQSITRIVAFIRQDAKCINWWENFDWAPSLTRWEGPVLLAEHLKISPAFKHHRCNPGKPFTLLLKRHLQVPRNYSSDWRIMLGLSTIRLPLFVGTQQPWKHQTTSCAHKIPQSHHLLESSPLKKVIF